MTYAAPPSPGWRSPAAPMPEISIFTGLSPDDVQQILAQHYLGRDPAIAENAAAKLAKLAETRTKL